MCGWVGVCVCEREGGGGLQETVGMEKQELWSATQETALDPGSCAKTLKLPCVCARVYMSVCPAPQCLSLEVSGRK